MTLKELKQQLLALSPDEKVQAIQLLAQSLGSNWQGIEKTPRVCGGEARIAKTKISLSSFKRLIISCDKLFSTSMTYNKSYNKVKVTIHAS